MRLFVAHSGLHRNRNISLVACIFISACGGGGDSTAPTTPKEQTSFELSSAYFRDTDENPDAIGGNVYVGINTEKNRALTQPITINLYWLDGQGNGSNQPFLSSSIEAPYDIAIPANTVIPIGTTGIKLRANNDKSDSSIDFTYHDYKGNVDVSGPGGNEARSWQYGEQRPTIKAHRDNTTGMCVYDNGLVAITDMNNLRDNDWESGVYSPNRNQVNEDAFPPYTFACTPPVINQHKAIDDGDSGLPWTYSTINDAMYYGTFIYDTYLKHLKEPPLNDKLRLRVHYDSRSLQNAVWDGAYASFNDGYPFVYSMATLDIIAHEIAHGVLDRISALKAFPSGELSDDARTLHEAFADISGVLVKKEFQQDDNVWIHGAEGRVDDYPTVRKLDAIITHSGAIASYLDYDDADNAYQRIGLVTYPFYKLSQDWGIVQTYQVYLHAAKHCWKPTDNFVDSAHCVHNAAVDLTLDPSLVVDAMKTVKIRLDENDVLSHFNYVLDERTVSLTNNSVGEIAQYDWQINGETVSNLMSPTLTVASSGEFQITLFVKGHDGKRDQFTRNILVK